MQLERLMSSSRRKSDALGQYDSFRVDCTSRAHSSLGIFVFVYLRISPFGVFILVNEQESRMCICSCLQHPSCATLLYSTSSTGRCIYLAWKVLRLQSGMWGINFLEIFTTVISVTGGLSCSDLMEHF